MSCKYNNDIECYYKTCSVCTCEMAVQGFKDNVVEKLEEAIADTTDEETGIAARWAYTGAIEIVKAGGAE